MAFKLNITTTTQNGGGVKKEVDWNELNEHVIETAGTANKSRTIVGIISGIYDLGEQEREDAEVIFEGNAEAEAKEIEKYPETYFEDGIDQKTKKPVRLKRYPQKAVQQCAVAVDFPQVIVDKGLRFGKSNPQPLRLMLNGEFTLGSGVRVVGRPYSIVETKFEDGTWAFAKNNGLHKLADAAGILDDKGYFKKDRIGELQGKAALFEFRVYMKPNKKNPDKKFFTEEIKLAGKIPEGLEAPAFEDTILHGVNLFGENDDDSVKQLRLSVRNTIQQANNYEISDIKKIFDANAPQGQTTETKTADEAPTTKPAETGIEPNFDDDVPF
jgi:hypothetical protein